MRSFLVAAGMVLAGSLFAADPALLRLAMPDAQFMAGINVEQVKLSPFGRFLLEQSGQQSANAGLQMLIETTGFDPRRDIREILVAAPGQPGDGSTLILLRGTFDVPRLVEAALSKSGSVETYNGIPVIQPNAQQHHSVAFPDATIAIAGDPAAVHAAIDRKAAPASIGSALAAEVNQLSSAQDVWFVSMVPFAQVPPQGPSPYAALNKIQRANGGVKFGNNLAVNLQAAFATAQDASDTVAMLQSLLNVADLYIHDSYISAAGLLQNLNLSNEGQAVRLLLSVPEQQLEQVLNNSQAHAAAPLLP